MIINLDNVAYVSIAGLRLELHFKDTSSHMRRFCTIEEMLKTIEGWQQKTAALNSTAPIRLTSPRTPVSSKAAKASRTAPLPLTGARL